VRDFIRWYNHEHRHSRIRFVTPAQRHRGIRNMADATTTLQNAERVWLVVPVLVDAGPVQWVAGLEFLLWVEVEPALPTLCLRAGAPGNTKGLQTATGKLDQVLLQRGNAEGVLDLEVGQLAVGAVGIDEELAVTGKKNVC
jgi:hypothetical protein